MSITTRNVLLVSTTLIIITGGLMALLVGLVLPEEFLRDNYVPKDQKLNVNRYIRARNKVRKYGSIAGFTWLVSVSMPRYLDVNDSYWMFACTGAVISINTVLTGDDCVRDPFNSNDFYRSIVRSESRYFLKGGVEHRIMKVFSGKDVGLPSPYDGLYILEVVPDFSEKVKILALGNSEVEWKVAIEAGWGGNEIAHVDIMKTDPFHFSKWHRDKDYCCRNLELCSNVNTTMTKQCYITAVVHGRKKPSKVNGRPLVISLPSGTGNDTLLGIQMDLEYMNESTTFIDLRYEEFVEWATDPESYEKIMYRPSSEKMYLYRQVDYQLHRQGQKREKRQLGYGQDKDESKDDLDV
ncbi:uncharacterized protein isoform X1 [Leptinotarsa decemlineata]|uniref:uncharacterized protein isoform X1 n=1 Tax=Leptinotarsa decemlineata TaxID=7539 RepID=UPI003D30731B